MERTSGKQLARLIEAETGVADSREASRCACSVLTKVAERLTWRSALDLADWLPTPYSKQVRDVAALSPGSVRFQSGDRLRESVMHEQGIGEMEARRRVAGIVRVLRQVVPEIDLRRIGADLPRSLVKDLALPSAPERLQPRQLENDVAVVNQSDQFDAWLSSEPTRGWISFDLPDLLEDFPGWVNRRVETLGIISERQFARRNSVDLTITKRVSSPYGDRSCVVPLAFLYKRYLRRFDITDETGRVLPVLTEEQSSRIAEVMLQHLVFTDVVNRLGEIDGPKQFAGMNAALLRVLGPHGATSLRSLEADPQWQPILENPVVGALIRNLAASFVLFAVIEARESQRRVIKYSYVHRFPTTLTTGQRFWLWLGWTPFPLSIPGVLPTASASYHAEVEAPPGAIIAAAQLADDSQQLDLDSDDPRIAHLRFSRISSPGQPVASPQPVGIAHVDLEMYPAPNQVLRQVARGIHLVTGVLLAGVVLKQAEIHGIFENATLIPGSASSILVAVPAVVAFYLAVQEHPLIQRMLFGHMVRAGFAAGLAFVAAVTLSLEGLAPGTRLAIWEVLSAISLANSAVTFESRRRAVHRSTDLKKGTKR